MPDSLQLVRSAGIKTTSNCFIRTGQLVMRLLFRRYWGRSVTRIIRRLNIWTNYHKEIAGELIVTPNAPTVKICCDFERKLVFWIQDCTSMGYGL